MTQGKDKKAKVEQGAVTKGDVQAELEGLKLAILDVLVEYRDRWRQLLGNKALRVEYLGKPVAVVMAYEDFEALLEQLEDFEDAQSAREVLDAIRRGEEEIVPWEKVKAELITEGILDE